MNTLPAPNEVVSVVKTAGTLPMRPAGAADAVAVREVSGTASAGADTARPAPPTRESVNVAAKQIESFVKSTIRNLDFSVDDSLGVRIVRVVDPETQDVIRQIPAEETLRIAKTLEFVNSVLVRQKA